MEQQLFEARASLREAIKPTSPPGPEEQVATAAEGRISVTLGGDGRIGAIEIHPTALREGTAYLAEELRTAVNRVLDARAAASATDEPLPDLAAISAVVERMQDEGLRQLREINAAVGETMRKLQRGA